MKVLITGGAGFIGSHLTEAHLKRGDEVVVLDDFSTGNRDNLSAVDSDSRLKVIEGTILSFDDIRRGLDGVDRIYHLAAAVGVQYIIKHPLRSLQVNLRGTENILEEANKTKTPVFIASTSEVYGKTDKVPFSEEDDRVQGSTTVSRWGYANSKAMDEFLALAYYREEGLPVILGRFFNTVGPRQTGRYGMVIPRFVKAALNNEPLLVYGSGDQTRCFLDASDVVRFVLALFDSNKALGNIYNLGSTERVSIIDLAEKVIALSGSNSEIKRVSYADAFEEGFEDMFHRVPDMTKFDELTGLTPEYSLEDILKRVIEYHKR